MREYQPWLLFSGDNLTGKDTIARSVKEIYPDFEFRSGRLSTRPNPYDEFFIKMCKKTEVMDLLPIKALLVIAGTFFDLKTYELDSGVVQVSLSALRSSAFYESCKYLAFSKIFDFLIEQYPTPEKAVCLIASLEAKRERLATRDKATSFDRQIIDEPERVQRFSQALTIKATTLLGAKKIDTSQLSIEQTKQKVIDYLLEKQS